MEVQLHEDIAPSVDGQGGAILRPLRQVSFQPVFHARRQLQRHAFRVEQTLKLNHHAVDGARLRLLEDVFAMGGHHHRGSAAGKGQTRHVQGVAERLCPIVHRGKDMAVDVEHARPAAP